MLQQGVINMNDFSFSNRILTLSCHKVFHLPCLSKKKHLCQEHLPNVILKIWKLTSRSTVFTTPATCS